MHDDDLEKCPKCEKEETHYWIKKFGMCYWCNHKRVEAEWLKKTQKETVEEGSSSNEDNIICPHCGNVCSEDDLHETTDTYCDECDKEFHVEIEYTPHYSTSKLEKKEA